MKFGGWMLSAAGVALVVSVVPARAQVGVYGMYSVTQYTGVQCLSVAPIPCSNGTSGRSVTTSSTGTSTVGSPNTGSVSPTGGSGGIYYDFKTFGPVRFGVDFRGGANHANKSAVGSGGGDGITSGTYFLGGVRGSFHTPYNWLTPYAQVSAGYARSNVTVATCQTTSGATLLCNGNSTVTAPRSSDNFLQYEGFVGADIHVLPVVDLRLFELGIGNMNRIGTGAGIDGSSSVGVRSLGAGVVFHLPTL